MKLNPQGIELLFFTHVLDERQHQYSMHNLFYVFLNKPIVLRYNLYIYKKKKNNKTYNFDFQNHASTPYRYEIIISMQLLYLFVERKFTI